MGYAGIIKLHTINQVSVTNFYPLPKITKLDLSHAYQQLKDWMKT